MSDRYGWRMSLLYELYFRMDGVVYGLKRMSQLVDDPRLKPVIANLEEALADLRTVAYAEQGRDNARAREER